MGPEPPPLSNWSIPLTSSFADDNLWCSYLRSWSLDPGYFSGCYGVDYSIDRAVEGSFLRLASAGYGFPASGHQLLKENSCL